ncbi:DUF1381 domain-containing protein [Staphylococcus pseudintermedius]|uniref:DUF1381 domain-containing protein n=1 Tax=Staphylococcus phage vB_SpsS_QT1 TaxID=2510452 RepID=A0A4P6QX93_9CAUD|nr:DUF1381 domain-containing protein [Staphylococcus pseudintermedius]YP_009823346.1 transcriptional regulator [Staphylococcus phage vB_SpsS_QT1]EGQ0302301.1 DUF1381 domain-containing protein [Staphylococcus pseudintermedius]EGQ0373406.1 DUF1381 domain-containing protein [Staphylococcus pseudintermedius]EGQ1283075.1 DUF1381 domain-containing protein [Staphylococcus pseudintermedius]EGQ1603506.1 DUF1381 domain-containing protein [Staphylococcus pseudintermedius]EGQ1651176.1 DUF1381 domain-cont
MTQYLITTFTDSTGQTFTEATKARENQTFTVVLAESKEEAIKKYESPKVKQQVITCNMPDWA